MGNRASQRKRGGEAARSGERGDAAVEDAVLFPINDKMTVDDFELLTVVGKGSFGKVMQVRKKDTGEILAMKVLKKHAVIKRKQVEHTKAERRILANFDHPFIVSMRYAFQTETKLYMILDFFNGGEMFYHLANEGRFEESRVRFYIAQIILAIECLHDNDIIYRDLKPENILLDQDGNVKLTDFGLSKESITDTTLTHTFCGTPEYLAPEVLKKEGYGKPVDWWSVGALTFEMLTGRPPFSSDNVNVMYDKILYSKVKYPKFISAGAKAFIESLLERNLEKRLGTVNGSTQVKAHPFFESIDWEKLYRKELKPPFKPSIVAGDMDVSNIDDEFKSEKVKDTPVQPTDLSNIRFSNFTYNNAASPLHKSSEDALPE